MKEKNPLCSSWLWTGTKDGIVSDEWKLELYRFVIYGLFRTGAQVGGFEGGGRGK